MFMPESIRSSPILKTNIHSRGTNRHNQYSRALNYSSKHDDDDDESIFDQRKSKRELLWEDKKPFSNGTGGKRYTNSAPKVIKNETFETSDGSGGRKLILNRSVKKDDKKESDKITILKPNDSRSSSAAAGPIILSRNKNSEASSAASSEESSGVRILNSSAPLKIASKPSVPSSIALKLAPERFMKRPFRLIDDDFYLLEGHTAFNAYLVEQTNFLVVGVLGLQGVGKSTVASLLLNSEASSKNNAKHFSAAGSAQTLSAVRTTTGLDIFVSHERLIVMDFPALMSPAVMDATSGKDPSLQAVSLEVQVAMKSLQFVSLALKTCHVVIIVQDNLATSGELMALLQVAATLNRQLDNASIKTGMSPKTDPSVIVVQNKCSPNMSRSQVSAMEQIISVNLSTCDLPFNCGLGGPYTQGLNLLMLPHRNKLQSEGFSGSEIRKAVFSSHRRMFLNVPLTEKTWFVHLIREWERMKNSRLYLDYSKLFP